MAEIGIVASVICVAGCGFRLSLLLNAVGCEVASAGIEIHSISKGVTLFSLMLKQVGQTLQMSDSVHSSEALETAQEITSECQMVFDEIQEMLDRVTSKKSNGSLAPSVHQRFKWCFKKARVQYLLGQLESLKMSLLVMLQILQLGKLMASMPKAQGGDPNVENAPTNDAIAQERVETQNLVIVRYWQISRLDRLFAAAEDEETGEANEGQQQRIAADENAPLAIEAPPDCYRPSTALVRLPIVSLGELDTTLSQIKESPREMLRVSECVINPLLNRWTRWQEIYDHADDHSRNQYAPSVQNLYGSDEEKSKEHSDSTDRADSPRGYYLEGTTTDWRKPHSAAAKQEAAHLRRKYSTFQPSISVDSSEEDHDRGAARAHKGHSTRHVIDSSSDTSDSEPEPEPRPQRRNSNARSTDGARSRQPPPSPRSLHSYPNSYDSRASFGGRNGGPPINHTQNTARSSFSQSMSPGVTRPVIHPGQHHQPHYSYPPPMQPLNTSNGPNVYAPPSPYSPHVNAAPHPPPYPGHNVQQLYPPRYMPGQAYRMPPPGQQQPPPHEVKITRSQSRISPRSSRHQRSSEDLKKAEKSRKQKNMKKSATKGILGASALAAFLEAVEGLEL